MLVATAEEAHQTDFLTKRDRHPRKTLVRMENLMQDVAKQDEVKVDKALCKAPGLMQKADTF